MCKVKSFGHKLTQTSLLQVIRGVYNISLLYVKVKTTQTYSSVVCYTAVLWEGALRDDTKNGCIAD